MFDGAGRGSGDVMEISNMYPPIIKIKIIIMTCTYFECKILHDGLALVDYIL